MADLLLEVEQARSAVINAAAWPMRRAVRERARGGRTNRALPLAGVKVLDFSRAAWCAMVLADFGAEVIKVEHPARGDDTRDWGLRIGDTETTYFNSVNRSKRSICLDLQTEAGSALRASWPRRPTWCSTTSARRRGKARSATTRWPN